MKRKMYRGAFIVLFAAIGVKMPHFLFAVFIELADNFVLDFFDRQRVLFRGAFFKHGQSSVR